ncbi:MAG TPA: vWA domain-containing protein, partial [Nannocystaceae bacterium]|nr:vWA domain-containing protein [Nannocystaceae bacterium]
ATTEESESVSVSADDTAGTQSASSLDATDTLDADATADASATDSAGNDCPVLDLTIAAEPPTIILLLDQSGSMTADFNGESRWNTLRDTLLDPDLGVVVWFQNQVRFGLALYSNTLGNPECPELVETAPMEMSYEAIADAFDAAAPSEHTPTGESIAAVTTELAADPTMGEKIILLATDGEPDTCAQPDPQMGQAESVDAAAAAFEMGIHTFVVSVGEETSAQHLQDVANAGAGVQPGDPEAEFYVAVDQPSLAQAFVDIIKSTRDCAFDLTDSVMAGMAGSCTVDVNGNPVMLDDPDGWQLNSPTEIELLGGACDAVQQDDATVEMVCQCDSVED